MNNDMKWEAVDHDQLTIGQQVRVRPTDGKTWLEGQVDHITAFHGARIALEGTATTVHTDGRWDVERAVPERTLPTEPGRYIAASMADSPHMANIMTLRGDGLWDDESTAAKIEPLVRLVPSTDVEEAEKRARADLNHASQYLTTVRSNLRESDIDYLLHVLKGKGSNV